MHEARSTPRLLDAGLYPYTALPGHVREPLLHEIGLVGMNEACLNAQWLRADMTQEPAQAFTKDVLNHMRARLADYQEQYGDLYNLEATPAEEHHVPLRQARQGAVPDIITANEQGKPYYTNCRIYLHGGLHRRHLQRVGRAG